MSVDAHKGLGSSGTLEPAAELAKDAWTGAGVSILDRNLIADKILFLLVMPNAGFVFKKSRLKAEAVLAEQAGSQPGGIMICKNLFFNVRAFFTSR